LYLSFAWRYFKAKKSANAINIIAWVTTAVIAFATCCQILVLSVYNGFEDLVKSLYSSFYCDYVVKPVSGKTFTLTESQINNLRKEKFITSLSLIIEEKALLKNNDVQTIVTLKAVDSNYLKTSNIAEKIVSGSFNLGDAENPKIVVGSGVQYNASINVNEAFPVSEVTLILPKKNNSKNLDDALSEGNCLASGVFAIQQEIDDKYAFTNIDFMRQQLGLAPNTYSAIDIKIVTDNSEKDIAANISKILGNSIKVQNRFEQNSNLYNTLKLEKWAIYAILTLILIIAAFNMVSSLSMLVLEKSKDISILKSMGTTSAGIKKIFLSEGLLLGAIGAGIGIVLALIICLLQLQFKFVKISGGTFLIDYFPVKMLVKDFALVALSSLTIAFLAAWYPAQKAANKNILIK
jgi:lipoprotein-releasing system permease protein